MRFGQRRVTTTPSLRLQGFEDENDDEYEYEARDERDLTFMSTASHQLTGPIDNDPKDEFFYVIHPLDDLPEEKVKSDHLLPLKMTLSVRWSLFTLRAYLIVMMLLLFYHVFDLARQLWR